MRGPRADRKPFRLVNRHGDFNVVLRGIERRPWQDLYHWVLDTSWRNVIVACLGYYLMANLVFTLLFMLGGDCIEGVNADSFLELYSFSVQTFSTIGYGAMAPKTAYAHVVVIAEAFTGLLSTAILTGMLFAKFARPTARVSFSEHMLIKAFDGKPTLMFRMANMRANQIVNATLHVQMASFEETEEGTEIRRIYDLELLRSRTSMFVLSWTGMHPIDDDSPLEGVTLEQWRAHQIEILVTLSGVDETFEQTIHARHSYTADDLVFNGVFEDMLTTRDDGMVEIDYTKLRSLEVKDVDEDPSSSQGAAE